MSEKKTLKKVNQFRPQQVAIFAPNNVRDIEKLGYVIGDDGLYTLPTGTYEVVFNETLEDSIVSEDEHFIKNGITFGTIYSTPEGSAVLITVSPDNCFIKIAPGTTISEGTPTIEKRGRGRPPKQPELMNGESSVDINNVYDEYLNEDEQ